MQEHQKAGLIIPVKITIYDDRSYSFLKSPPACFISEVC
jgi:ribosomal protein L11